MPEPPLRLVLRSRQEHVTRMLWFPQPGDQFHQIGLCHRGTARGWPSNAAPDVKKNGATRTGHGWIGIMPNFHQPTISKIGVTHLLFGEPRRRIRRVRNGDKAIVVRTAHVIAPGVGGRYLVKGVIGPRGKVSIVSVDLTDSKDPRRSTP